MKRQIRSGAFETNSSSVHTITFSRDYVKEWDKMDLPMNSDGKILVDFGFFGREYRIYTSQSDKLSYLMTQLYYIAGYPDDMNDIYDKYEFKKIEAAVMKHCPKCTGIKLINNIEGYIDHQSVPYGCIDTIDVCNEDEVINFIFNDQIYLKTDSD